MSNQELDGKTSEKYFKDKALKSLLTFILWGLIIIIVLIIIPIFFSETLRFLSPIFEMLGLSFLIFDENNLLSNNSLSHGKASNSIYKILYSFSNFINNLNWHNNFKDNQSNEIKDECRISYAVEIIESVKYGTDDPDEQLKEAIHKLEKISKHSIVRKTGYCIMGIGFFYQLIYIICY